MIRMPLKIPSHRFASGVTLIELLGALALMASVLVALLTAQARYARQSHETRLRLQAIEATDTLLTQWWTETGAIPAPESGWLDTDPPLAWRTHRIDRPDAQLLAAQIVLLDILRPTPPGISPGVADGRPSFGLDQEPLVRIELLVPDLRESEVTENESSP